MKNSVIILTSLIIILVFPAICSADAGYLGSITSGPSPVIVETEHASIEMTAEEVVIKISCIEEEDFPGRKNYNSEITASFIFSNEGGSESVYMAIPLDVRTVFISYIYNYINSDSILKYPVVKVDGEQVTVKLLFGSKFYETSLCDCNWEKLSLFIDPFFPDQPDFGKLIYFKRFDNEMECFINPVLALAYWKVDFAPGESHLVEYIEKYEMTSDYEEGTFRLTYPLFTGATWAGDIGYGRISIVLDESCQREDLQFYYGIGLPEPQEYQNYKLDFISSIENHIGYSTSNLSEFENCVYPHAVIWEFTNLEPTPSTFTFQSFYPDIGDIGTEYNCEYIEKGENIENPWIKSQVYLYFGSNKPYKFFVINMEGVPIYDRPYGTPISEEHYIAPFSTVCPIEWQDHWLKAKIIDHINDIREEAWIPIYILDSDSNVIPYLMPYLM